MRLLSATITDRLQEIEALAQALAAHEDLTSMTTLLGGAVVAQHASTLQSWGIILVTDADLARTVRMIQGIPVGAASANQQ